MQLNIYKDHHTLSLEAAEAILATVKNNPTAVLCLATGDTPAVAYELLVKKAMDEQVDFSHCIFIALDEWVGILPENEGSCHYFLESRLFKPLNISASQVHLFDGMATDLAGECKKMDEAIAAKGGIDLMLVGVGLNGHVGFNEPGVSADLYAHVINLDDITRLIGQKYFQQNTVLKQGITLGLKHVLESKKLVMMASGLKKAEVMKKALEEEINILMPAGIIRMHSQGVVMMDETAATYLTVKPA